MKFAALFAAAPGPLPMDKGRSGSPATLSACGGKGGIRTLEGDLSLLNRLAGGPVRPLWHLPIETERRGRDSNPRSFRSAVFKTAAIDRSATSPCVRRSIASRLATVEAVRIAQRGHCPLSLVRKHVACTGLSW